MRLKVRGVAGLEERPVGRFASAGLRYELWDVRTRRERQPWSASTRSTILEPGPGDPGGVAASADAASHDHALRRARVHPGGGAQPSAHEGMQQAVFGISTGFKARSTSQYCGWCSYRPVCQADFYQDDSDSVVAELYVPRREEKVIDA